MIIVLCGVRGSGKDTIGDILRDNHGFTKEAFANPLKAMVKHAFPAFTDEDLYGPSKNRENPYKEYPRHDTTFQYPNLPRGSRAVWYPLGNKRGHTLVDADDVERVAAHTWGLFNKGREDRTTYAKTDIKIGGRKVSLSLHRFLMSPGDDYVVDHINGDGLDNRRVNLRLCSIKENQRNLRKRAAGSASSPYKGVGWDDTRKLWLAKIAVDGKTLNLGRFPTEREAAAAYDVAARKHFGAYARLNSDCFLTPRTALQELGTGWGRALYTNVWIDACFERITKARLAARRWDPVLQAPDLSTFDRDYVITDGRFLNEVRRSRELGGMAVKLTRGMATSTDSHPSEAELRTMPDSEFDLVFDNARCGLEDLPKLVEVVLATLRDPDIKPGTTSYVRQ